MWSIPADELSAIETRRDHRHEPAGLEHEHTDTQTAVRYDRDSDGIVTLTLDDPTASANTMNELYQSIDGGRRPAAVRRAGRRHRRRPHQRQEDLLRRRQPQEHDAGDARRRRADLRDGRGHQGRPAPPRDLPPPGRRRDQRRRAGRRPRDRAGGQPPHRRRRPLGEDRAARGHARPAPRRRRGHPRRTHARAPVRADGRAAARAPSSSPQGALEKGLVDERRRRPARSSSPPRRRGSSSTATTRTRRRTRGTARATRCPAARPRTPELAQFLPAFPALLRKQTKGAVYPAPRAIMAAAVEGAQVDFDTASRIESPLLHQPGRQPAGQEHDPGVLLRPPGDQLRLAASRRASSAGRPPRSASSAPG